MLRTKTAIVVTVLMIGNFAVSLQAVPLQIVQAEPAPSNGKNLKKRISKMLQDRGLEPTVADAKAANLFTGDERFTDLQLHHLRTRTADIISNDALDNVLSRRALFESPVDLTSADNLTGLLHEALGKAPDETLLKTVAEIASMNRALYTVNL